MDVELYVYDLTKGMARSMSRQLLGIQIDAVYHTALVFNGVEYFFGQGVQTCYPGSTHHGAPMEVIKMGQTQLPMDVILDYLESLKQVYTPESYDLFAHNCNNFTNDFSMFLVGKGIPDHITSLPQTVLNTPFGQMLKPQIDASMRNITQAPVPAQNVPPRGSVRPTNGVSHQTKPDQSSQPVAKKVGGHGQVYNVTQMSILDNLMSAASASCTVIFFTSSTCAPCKIAYPTYDSLAAENPKCVFIKVDINEAHAIGSRYQIRATPTFMTFLRGTKQDEWAGTNPAQLRGNVTLLVQQAFPSHPHASLKVPVLQSGSLSPVLFNKLPPLDKVIAKMGSSASDPAVREMKTFLQTRASEGAREALLPDLKPIASFLQSASTTLSPDTLFTAYDLLRCFLLDARVSGWLATESGPNQTPTLTALLTHVTNLISADTCPYNLRLVALQLGCNLFTSPVSTKTIFSSDLAPLLATLASSSLLAHPDKPAVRAAASSLAFNLSTSNYRVRRESDVEALPEDAQVELAASLLEMLGNEDVVGAKGGEGVHAAVMALGYLVNFGGVDGEVWDLCKALDAGAVLGRLAEGSEGLGAAVRDVRKVMPTAE